MASACATVAPAGFRALPLPLAQLSLAAVLQCGQSFRWSIFPLVSNTTSGELLLPTHEYRLCLRDRVVCLRQSPDTLFYRSAYPPSPPSPKTLEQREAETLAWIRDYFQLDIDLVDLYDQWAKRDPVFQRHCSQRFSGIRMLRQDPFENLISFICSSNNNIARITKMVKSLCQHYSPALISLPGPESTDTSETYHPFPPPSVLAAPQVSATLRSLGFGYRAEFIQKTAEMLVETRGSEKNCEDGLEPAERWLHTLRSMSTSEAREELLKLMGVGRKVADCILLASLDKREVIPVDTHVHQIAMKHYGVSGSSKGKTAMNTKLYDAVSSKLADVWGEYAGWAHSVLFTSDLKSFASYGLSSPSPSPSVQGKKARQGKAAVALVTPPATPTPSASPRKRKVVAVEQSEGVISPEIDEAASTLPVFDESLSMADRVKRRRRVRTSEVSVVTSTRTVR
ncbi:DNA glycosylase [Rhodofomes roseus]|uniref:DNA-(apurinic or apyrimidinic site) lyase n=1 Tax=Rhodofomes roseus TaxID=34475 RepID=A0ABQ8K746_9APHY|nr:DNA glycosylase [Rhodofomes roseus]KAH9833075.1 DNA glycosylase [Rhodofomes roseus]